MIRTATALRSKRRPTQSDPIRRGLKEVAGFGANPGALRMLTYRPDDLAPGAPLVVVLHGCGQTAEAYAIGAGWRALADRHGFALLCPEQSRDNNAGRCFNWFEPGDIGRGEGEAASISAMVDHAVATHGIDASRVFVTGLSAGGAMTLALLAAYPDQFAGGGVIAGLPVGAARSVPEAFWVMMQGAPAPAGRAADPVRATSPHAGPWPRLSVWQGDADNTVAPVNAERIIAQWIDLQGLSAAPTRTASRGADRTQIWEDRAGRALVELHMIEGMGHGAPLATGGVDGCGRAGPYLLETGISSALGLCRFWGLTEPALSMASAPADRSGGRAAAASSHAGRGLDIGAVINKALKAAGLMK